MGLRVRVLQKSSFLFLIILAFTTPVHAVSNRGVSSQRSLSPSSTVSSYAQLGLRTGWRWVDHLVLSDVQSAYAYPQSFSLPMGVITWRSLPFEYGGRWGFQAHAGVGKIQAVTQNSNQALDLYMIPLALGLGYERVPGLLKDTLRPSLSILFEYQGYIQSGSPNGTSRSGELGVDWEFALSHPLRWMGFPAALLEIGVQRIGSIQKQSGDFSGVMTFLGLRHNI